MCIRMHSFDNPHECEYVNLCLWVNTVGDSTYFWNFLGCFLFLFLHVHPNLDMTFSNLTIHLDRIDELEVPPICPPMYRLNFHVSSFMCSSYQLCRKWEILKWNSQNFLGGKENGNARHFSILMQSKVWIRKWKPNVFNKSIHENMWETNACFLKIVPT